MPRLLPGILTFSVHLKNTRAMAGTPFSSFVALLFVLLSTQHPAVVTPPLHQQLAVAVSAGNEIAVEDSLVNYCKLVRAGFFYGQKFADKKLGLSSQDVEFFNDLWKEVFNIPVYQTGITANEFVLGARFGEGNQAPFPPSSLYHQESPDTYLLFHIAKEVGMINSTTFAKCPSCVELSIAKINAYLKTAYLHHQISQMWLGTSTLKKITSTQDITDFWVFLRCMFIDDKINPKQKPYFINLPPVVKCPDTTIIKCKDEIKPRVSVGYRHCEIGGRIDTIGPMLKHGIDNCPGAIYHYKFIARDQCNKKDSAIQVFVIENEKPAFTCAEDTIVTCIEDLIIHQPRVTSSCSLTVKHSTRPPKLVKGKKNCPDAIYKMEYVVKDTCGREVNCEQTITIKNNPPKITCPADQTVECKKDIKEGEPKYTISCYKKAKKVSVTGPALVKGKEDCPGSVYELTYEVTDSCDRTAKCTQKFTIDNKGPEIKCPPNQEVLCYDDISTGPPADVIVSCNLKYDVKISDPVLIIGKPNCIGAVYSVTYTVTDACGRTDECEQLFTILQPDLKIVCPPDHTVMCEQDIIPETPTVSIACKLDYTITTDGPQLVKGEPDCPGAEYVIEYEVNDRCGRVKNCKQTFTIENPDPEIVCPPEMTVNCYDEIDPASIQLPVPVVSCNLAYTPDMSDPVLISGTDNCDGARYAIDVTVTDECNRKAECKWYFTLRVPEPEITCPPDMTIECEDEVVIGTPTVKTYCDQTYTVTTEVGIVSGIPNCPGTIYGIIYTITDDCDRKFECLQQFTISNADPKIECPPDRTVECVENIAVEDVMTSEVCEEGELEAALDLESGVAGCPGAVYVLTFTLIDSCGRVAACEQRFTLKGQPLEITCPSDTVIKSVTDIHVGSVLVTSSCELDDEVTSEGPYLVSGADGRPGAIYGITYTVTDECDREASCERRFRLIGIPDDGNAVICDCWNQYKRVSLDLVQNQNDKVHGDIAALIKKYGCEKVKKWLQSGAVELWNAWSSAEILGSGTGIASEIARRGDINIVMQNLDKITKAIEILEEAINGEPKKTLQIIAEWGFTEGITHLTGSGTPAAVFSAIKSLGEFAQYLNNEILIINIKTLANYADNDPNIFDPDHYLRKYANVHEIKPGDRVTWSDVHNTFRIAIWEYAQFRMNDVKLPPLNEIWNSQENMNLLRTVTYTMLQEVCQYWCYKLTLKQNLNKLIQEQSLLLRFKAVLDALKNYDCQGNDKPCTMPNAELKEVNGVFVCECVNGYKWDPGKIRCIPFTDCSGFSNSVEVYRGDRYECDCPEGYEWNADRTACIQSKPDCPSYYPNTEAVWDAATNQYLCNCISGYEWNSTRTGCVIAKPDCPSFYPNTEAVWDAATNQYLCNCISGYEWNSTRTGCVVAKPDCPSYYPNTEAVWDAATNQYLCNCISGYEWNSTRTGCDLAKPDCPSYYPNTEAVWDAATNQYLCNCISGYEWNSTRTGCDLAKPDCPSFYPNTEAVWDAASNQYLCNCISGYQWNATRTGCDLAKPDCPSFYPNTEAVWDAATNQYLCNCITGYVWNSTRTGCVPAAPDCNSFYVNSIAVWDYTTNQYLCDCAQGYTWNPSRTQCIPFGAPDCVTFYANSTPYWDAATNQYLCYCLTGFEWNATHTECVKIGTGSREDPVVNPQQQKTGQCNVSYGSGANEPEQYTIDVYQTTGSVLFRYETFDVKDRIHIYLGGAKVFDSGCVGTNGDRTQTLTLNGSSVFRIVVDPQCETSESTSWNFTLGCPQ
ncbi:MAG TPA: hypothetical protein VI603_00320 [Saprospiraceae bacterium]|nr:hypothetical protein [Saprospiraceae bacterium]